MIPSEIISFYVPYYYFDIQKEMPTHFDISNILATMIEILSHVF